MVGLCSPRVDRFRDWLQAPVPLESTHPRFDIRRARPEEFDGIYDLVDESFGVERPRAVYDWLYRRNPYGLARCWVVIDRASGRLVGNTAAWPWPMARGAQLVEGAQSGDWVIAPRWQRQGISGLRAEVRRSHPWNNKVTVLSWPNEKSRGSGIKRDLSADILGPVPKAVLPLNTTSLLSERGWPALLARAGGSITDAVRAMWRTVSLGGQSREAITQVRRFDAAFDDVTQRCMAWPGFWSPHDADFLNWRYLDHPAGQYVAFALADSTDLAGYYVLKIVAPAAWLMEFAAPTSSRGIADALLRHAIETARDAGCSHLKFSAPAAWRHWKLFRTAGFLPALSDIYVWPAGEGPEVMQLSMWQWVPGDMDDL